MTPKPANEARTPPAPLQRAASSVPRIRHWQPESVVVQLRQDRLVSVAGLKTQNDSQVLIRYVWIVNNIYLRRIPSLDYNDRFPTLQVVPPESLVKIEY